MCAMAWTRERRERERERGDERTLIGSVVDPPREVNTYLAQGEEARLSRTQLVVDAWLARMLGCGAVRAASTVPRLRCESVGDVPCDDGLPYVHGHAVQLWSADSQHLRR